MKRFNATPERRFGGGLHVMARSDTIEAVLEPLRRMLARCRICGNRCGIDRTACAVGRCRADAADLEHVRVASHTLHFGEEPPLVGRGGSGTVFFAHCNLRCVFCQNHQISQGGLGTEIHYRQLADIFLDLQRRGAENVNLVTPTHFIYPILLALHDAHVRGLDLPLVYNTNAYEDTAFLRLLDGIVDVYLPDMKYMDAAEAERYSGVKGYPAVAKEALAEMLRQTGLLNVENGVAKRGIILRHLVLPDNLGGSYDLLLWLRDAGLTGITLSLMSQYAPQHHAGDYPELEAPISPKEYEDLVEYALTQGLECLLVQETGSQSLYVPDFRKREPFAPP